MNDNDFPIPCPIEDGRIARAELNRLTAGIVALQEKVVSIRTQALECYRDIGELIEIGQRFTHRVRTIDGTRLGLKGWAEEMNLKRQTAYKYMNIKQNWSVLKDLKGDQETLEGALRVLAIADEKTPATSKAVAIEPSQLLALARKHGCEDANAAELEAFLNAAMKLGRIKKTITLKPAKDCVTGK